MFRNIALLTFWPLRTSRPLRALRSGVALVAFRTLDTLRALLTLIAFVTLRSHRLLNFDNLRWGVLNNLKYRRGAVSGHLDNIYRHRVTSRLSVHLPCSTRSTRPSGWYTSKSKTPERSLSS